jgi:hypothetical protein
MAKEQDVPGAKALPSLGRARACIIGADVHAAAIESGDDAAEERTSPMAAAELTKAPM